MQSLLLSTMRRLNSSLSRNASWAALPALMSSMIATKQDGSPVSSSRTTEAVRLTQMRVPSFLT
jgi:hypothetical protein